MNEGTRIFDVTIGGTPAIAPGPEDAFSAAYPRLSALAAGADPASVVVAAVGPDGEVAGAALVAARSAVVVGRHSECHLRLPHASISLRQIVILVRPPDGGAPIVHLWDLHTPQPMLTEGNRPGGALIVDGATCLTIGPYALWVVPARGVAGRGWPSDAFAALLARPRVQYLDQKPPEPAMPHAAPARAARAAHTGDDSWGSWPERTLITRVPPPVVLDASDDGPPVGSLRFRYAGQDERYQVSAERLARGVLVGRYDRCNVLAADDDINAISRVHVLLVRIGGEVWAIDTASTNGVWLGDREVFAEVLDDRCSLGLGTVGWLDWQAL